MMEAPKIGIVTSELRLDWDRIGALFATFGIAYAGIANVVDTIAFLIQGLAHHA